MRKRFPKASQPWDHNFLLNLRQSMPLDLFGITACCSFGQRRCGAFWLRAPALACRSERRSVWSFVAHHPRPRSCSFGEMALTVHFTHVRQKCVCAGIAGQKARSHDLIPLERLKCSMCDSSPSKGLKGQIGLRQGAGPTSQAKKTKIKTEDRAVELQSTAFSNSSDLKSLKPCKGTVIKNAKQKMTFCFGTKQSKGFKTCVSCAHVVARDERIAAQSVFPSVGNASKWSPAKGLPMLFSQLLP